MKLALKFFLPITVIAALLAAALGYLVARELRDQAIDLATYSIAEFVDLQTRAHISSPALFSLHNPAETEAAFAKLLSEVKTRDVIRIKVWDAAGRIIFSDDKSIVGKIFADNKKFREALGGVTAVEIKEPLAAENVSERGYRQVMEIYVPVRFSDSDLPVGVVETYFNLDRLNQRIAGTQETIWLIIGGALAAALVVFYIFLRLVVVNPLRNLAANIKEVKEKTLL